MKLIVCSISLADVHSWEVDETGRCCVLWLDFRSDDRDKKDDVEVRTLVFANLEREINLPLVGTRWLNCEMSEKNCWLIVKIHSTYA